MIFFCLCLSFRHTELKEDLSEFLNDGSWKRGYNTNRYLISRMSVVQWVYSPSVSLSLSTACFCILSVCLRIRFVYTFCLFVCFFVLSMHSVCLSVYAFCMFVFLCILYVCLFMHSVCLSVYAFYVCLFMHSMFVCLCILYVCLFMHSFPLSVYTFSLSVRTLCFFTLYVYMHLSFMHSLFLHFISSFYLFLHSLSVCLFLHSLSVCLCLHSLSVCLFLHSLSVSSLCLFVCFFTVCLSVSSLSVCLSVSSLSVCLSPGSITTPALHCLCCLKNSRKRAKRNNRLGSGRTLPVKRWSMQLHNYSDIWIDVSANRTLHNPCNRFSINFHIWKLILVQCEYNLGQICIFQCCNKLLYRAKGPVDQL